MESALKPQIIKQYLSDKHLSEKEFCKECNISLSSLKKILNLDSEVSLLHFIRVRYFLRLKGYLPSIKLD